MQFDILYMLLVRNVRPFFLVNRASLKRRNTSDTVKAKKEFYTFWRGDSDFIDQSFGSPRKVKQIHVQFGNKEE